MVTKGLTILLLAGVVTRTCFIEKLCLKKRKIHMKTHTIENFCTCEVTNCGKYLQSKSLCKPATLLWKNVITATLLRFWIQMHIGCFPERAYVDDPILTIKRCSSRHKTSPHSELVWSAFFRDFPAFGLNTERYSVKIWEKCGPEQLQIPTRFTQCM